MLAALVDAVHHHRLHALNTELLSHMGYTLCDAAALSEDATVEGGVVKESILALGGVDATGVEECLQLLETHYAIYHPTSLFERILEFLGGAGSDEDHLGDMDFKVAGTKDGVTALQMDIKITSITKDIMKNALAQAHEGRIHILGEMAKAIAEPRPQVSPKAPRIFSMKIPVDKIREVIGTGGKVIREIIEKTNTKIDITDDGVVTIASNNSENCEAAIDIINGIIAVPEEGKIYKGVITKIMDFGAFVRFLGQTE